MFRTIQTLTPQLLRQTNSSAEQVINQPQPPTGEFYKHKQRQERKSCTVRLLLAIIGNSSQQLQ